MALEIENKNTKYNLLNEIFILKTYKILWQIVFLFSSSIPLSASANDITLSIAILECLE